MRTQSIVIIICTMRAVQGILSGREIGLQRLSRWQITCGTLNHRRCDEGLYTQLIQCDV